MKKIKVLIVDDSSLVRKILKDALDKEIDLEVVGTANNGKSAIYKNEVLKPDVITMDIEMPIMDGLEALKRIICSKPVPVIMLSVFTRHGAAETFKALEYGAVDFIPKPSALHDMSVEEIQNLIVNKIKSAAETTVQIPEEFKGLKFEDEQFTALPRRVLLPKVSRLDVPFNRDSDRIIGIGTSTGGPSALMTVFQMIPEGFLPPIFIVQHMPEGFTKAFAERLNRNSTLNVKEAEDGDEVEMGRAYLAPGHSHMIVEKSGKGEVVRIFPGDKVSGHRPSIDVLFNSLADLYSSKVIGVIMTGMGKDGSDGIKKIKKMGGYTFAQDEESSVVYGMNRVAVQKGAIDEEVTLMDIPKKIVEYL